MTGQCAAKRDQPLSCASRQKSLETTTLQFTITIILTPHLVPPALVFRTPKGYRYPRLRTPALKSLFATMGKVLPSETAARTCVAKLALQKEEQIQELLRDKKMFKLWMKQRLLNKSILVCL